MVHQLIGRLYVHLHYIYLVDATIEIVGLVPGLMVLLKGPAAKWLRDFNQ